MVFMREHALDIFRQIYNDCKNSPSGESDFMYGDDRSIWVGQDHMLDDLIDRGLIRCVARGCGYAKVCLTPDGWDYFDAPAPQPVPSEIHIGTIQGSAIVGSQSNATINIGATMDDITQLVGSLPANQRQEAQALVEQLRRFESGEDVLKKGALSKFSDLLAKHSPLLSAVIGFIGKLLTGS